MIYPNSRKLRINNHNTLLSAHLFSDKLNILGTKELLTTAYRLRMNRSWIQHEGLPEEHFDIMYEKIKLAKNLNLVEVDPREFVILIGMKKYIYESKRTKPICAKCGRKNTKRWFFHRRSGPMCYGCTPSVIKKQFREGYTIEILNGKSFK